MGITVNEAIQRLLRLESDEKPLLIVLAGLSGSGKSTISKALLKKTDKIYVIASTDDMIDEAAQQRGLTYSEAFKFLSFKDMNKTFKFKIREAASKGLNLIIDRTNKSVKARQSLLSLTAAGNYTCVCVNVNLPLEQLHERLQKRGESTGKWITRDILAGQIKDWQTPSKSEGFDVILDVDNT